MPFRTLAGVALLVIGVPPTIARAQRTGDQARLFFTVSAGAVGGKQLWTVDRQPVQLTDPIDTLTLGRRIRSTITIGFAGTYFPGENLGLTVEGFLVGLGFEDSCRPFFSSGSGAVAQACDDIQGNKKPATSVMLAAGPVLRVNSRQAFSPYARLSLGFLFSTQSSLRTIGRFLGDSGTVDLIVYSDDRDSRVEPAAALAGGFTVPVAKGYQLRLEARDNIVGVQQVTGATAQAGVIPPHQLEFKHLFSLTIGFDVVLERRRGRRY